MPDRMKAFAISTGEAQGSIANLFRSHPSLDDRIATLQIKSIEPNRCLIIKNPLY